MAQNPPEDFPQEYVNPGARPYVQPNGNGMLFTTLLNNAEQALAFAQAHVDQVKAHVSQLRQLTGQ